MKQFSIEVKDRVGELARVTEILADRAINIVALASETSGSRPTIRVVTGDHESARKALSRSGREFSEQEILVVRVLDRPGELAKLARRLARSAVNVESIYLFGKNRGHTELALAVDDLKLAKKVLEIRD
ncbi:MAG: ACT domain-containing protein [Euryarchaeota archaeon]|nr:ACT domain-containing protein [Euryarchaeota archaeon]